MIHDEKTYGLSSVDCIDGLKFLLPSPRRLCPCVAERLLVRSRLHGADDASLQPVCRLSRCRHNGCASQSPRARRRPRPQWQQSAEICAAHSSMRCRDAPISAIDQRLDSASAPPGAGCEALGTGTWSCRKRSNDGGADDLADTACRVFDTHAWGGTSNGRRSPESATGERLLLGVVVVGGSRSICPGSQQRQAPHKRRAILTAFHDAVAAQSRRDCFAWLAD